jgi:hypothetical protein
MAGTTRGSWLSGHDPPAIPNAFTGVADTVNMDRRHTLALLLIVGVVLTGVAALGTVMSPESDGSAVDQQYPDGAGPDHIDFTTLDSDDQNVSHTPRAYWDSYSINYTAPPERPVVEGEYYINARTGAMISDLWNDARDYRNGTTYARVQPADGIPDEYRREQLESDDAYVYDDTTDAYYRYDQQYGQLAPTNVGRHTDILEFYAWEATNTTTQYGVPVITYRVAGRDTDNSRVSPGSGTLKLGVEDGIVYAYDMTLDTDEGAARYTYEVRPAPFPGHDWVETAREVSAANATQ